MASVELIVRTLLMAVLVFAFWRLAMWQARKVQAGSGYSLWRCVLGFTGFHTFLSWKELAAMISAVVVLGLSMALVWGIWRPWV
jgi:hypothetical protein